MRRLLFNAALLLSLAGCLNESEARREYCKSSPSSPACRDAGETDGGP